MVDDSLNKYSSDEEPVDFRVAIKHIMSKYRIPQGRLAEATDKSSSAISQVLSGIGDFKNETKRSIMYGLQHILSEEEITCDDTDRIEVSFYEQLSEDSSLGLRIQNERQQLDYFIDRGIRSAKNEIVFLGGVSHRKMSREWYAMLAERLINEPKLQIWLFLESPQNLFWRSKTLNHNIPNNSRSYEEMKNRFDLQKNEMHDAIKQFILNKFKTRADKFKQSIERLKILEVHIPIYTFITKLDEKLYITPRYHLRASKTYTELLQNGSMHYNQAKECIEFYQDLFRKKMYVSYPGEEKLVAYSDAGKIPRGELSRSSFSNDNQLETKVAHGLLFNRNGQLLLIV
jgi:hypothetical protein